MPRNRAHGRVGFRLYYEQKGKRKFIIGAEEMPPVTG
jgi:hypothetical protein